MSWTERLARTQRVRESYAAHLEDYQLNEEQLHESVEVLDQHSAVGSRHHVVPKFLLKAWANREQVQVYSKIDRTCSRRNVRDLAITDFYTFIDINGEHNSALESLFGQIENQAAPVLARLKSAFSKHDTVSSDDLVALGLFAAFQHVRTPRHRREIELQADWWAKSMMSGHISEDELAQITIEPDSNTFLERVSPTSLELLPLFLARPLTLITLDLPILLTSDDPVVINAGSEQPHHADCFLTDEQMEARFAKERRKKKRRQRDVSRIVHFWSPVPRGVGTALEIVLAISPYSALVWGPLGDREDGTFERERLTGAEAQQFASRVNDILSAQALDWIIARPDDATFASRDFPEPGPLLRVCDGTSAATTAINSTPTILRPRRLRPIG